MMKVVPAAEALSRIRSNPASIWCGNRGEEAGPNPNYAGNRIKDAFARLQVTPKFPIEAGSSVFAMGSCFAREIESAFRQTGFDVLSFDDSIFNEVDFKSDFEWGPSNFLNRYTTASMLLEIERIFDPSVLGDEELVLRRGDRLLDLHYTGSCEGGDLDLVKRRRAGAWQVGQGIKEADLVVLTLGLTEAWYDKVSEKYVNAEIDLIFLRRESSRFELHNLGFAENLENLEQMYSLLTRGAPDRRIVITVSPVPLQATFNETDIIIANMDSKSTLRAVVAEFCRRHPEVLYFPSFEIVMYSQPNHAWKPDRRHVTTEMVEFIVETFRAAHGLSKEAGPEELLTSFEDDRLDASSVLPDGFEIAANELSLHPFDRSTGTDAKVVFRSIDLGCYVRFESAVQSVRDDCEQVEFEISLLDQSTGVPLFGRSLVVGPGGVGDLVAEFPSHLGGTVDLALYTRMAGPTGSSANAWSKFVGPRLVRRA